MLTKDKQEQLDYLRSLFENRKLYYTVRHVTPSGRKIVSYFVPHNNEIYCIDGYVAKWFNDRLTNTPIGTAGVKTQDPETLAYALITDMYTNDPRRIQVFRL